MKILGIETSCDETAASVIEGEGKKAEVLSSVVSSQIEIHKKYGGVVPEVAAREHVLNILPVINEALEKAKLKEVKDIDAIAVTTGPGLITSLQAGVETAKTLSYAWGIPLVGINHIEGHIYANFIGANSEQIKNQKFPILILTVSGGHTMLAMMKGHGKYETVGETVDDAAGEAFDKAAAMLGIGYPGGPEISKQASNYKLPKNSKSKITLPRPMMNSADFNFSFSGLKTALLYELKKDPGWKKRIPEYCHEFQQAIIDVLIKKTIKAAEKFNVSMVLLSGGVAANKELRIQLEQAVKKTNIGFAMPELKYTTDNAAMVAAAGYFKALRGKYTPWQKIKADCNLEL